MRKTLLTIAATACALSMAVNGADAKTWKLGHIRPAGTPEDKASVSFANRVGELTKGKVEIKVFPASALGDWTVVQERISIGAVEMALQPQDTQIDKRLSIMFFPYLFTNLEQVKKNMEQDAPFRVEMEKLFKKQNIHALGFWPSFFGGLALKTLPKNWHEAGANKGIKIRVPADPAFAMNAQKMGYMVTPIPFSDAFTAMQTGIVDGIIGSGAVGYYSNFRDVVKYYLPINDHLEIYTLMMNLDLWNGLDDTAKSQVAQAAKEMEAERYQTFARDEAEYLKKLKDHGITIVDVTQEVINGFAEVASKECWPELAEKIDKPYIEHLLSIVKK